MREEAKRHGGASLGHGTRRGGREWVEIVGGRGSDVAPCVNMGYAGRGPLRTVCPRMGR